VRADEPAIDMPGVDDEMQKPVQKGDVRAESGCQVNIGLDRGRRASRIDHHQAGRPGTAAAVQHAGPQHSLRVSHVMADLENRLRRVEIRVRAGGAIGAERFDERSGGRRSAEAGVTVQVIGAEADLGHD
jgi:hypothetical protein